MREIGDLRFGLLTTFYPPYSFGGDGVAVQRLARALARRGHPTTVVHDLDAFELLGSPDRAKVESDEDEGVRRIGLGGTALGKLGLLATHQAGRPVLHAGRLRTIVEEFEVIHFHNVSLLGGPGILRYGDGVKLCTLHDYWFVCPTHILWRLDREPCVEPTCLRCTIATRRPPQAWRWSDALERGVEAVDVFLAGSEFARRAHRDRGLDARIEVLPPFVPDEEIARAPPEISVRERARPYVLFAGRLEKAKGVDDLLRAFSRIRGAELRIAGTGDHEATLRARAAGLDHVRFLGWVDRDRLRDLYRGAVAAVMPSRCYETFGLGVVEALAEATPVVVRDGGALSEVVEATEGGRTYHDIPGLIAALEDLLAHPERGREMGARGLRVVRERFSESVHTKRYLALVEEVLSDRSRSRRLGTGKSLRG